MGQEEKLVNPEVPERQVFRVQVVPLVLRVNVETEDNLDQLVLQDLMDHQGAQVNKDPGEKVDPKGRGDLLELLELMVPVVSLALLVKEGREDQQVLVGQMVPRVP